MWATTAGYSLFRFELVEIPTGWNGQRKAAGAAGSPANIRYHAAALKKERGATAI
ncbi:MAG: hypothetical protein J6I76_01170 [Oribacterium sp.]|nr:hypothetical protein [Oribacterium sp.]